VLPAFDGTQLPAQEFKARSAEFRQQLQSALTRAGYAASADPAQVDYFMVFVLLFVISLLGVMVYAPIAAWLVELFPARIRYTSMSLPYHIGNGWFGGFLPSIVFAIVAYTGNVYSGLWYPVAVCTLTVIIGTVWLRETRGVAAT
jgi:hypothetical protein